MSRVVQEEGPMGRQRRPLAQSDGLIARNQMCGATASFLVIMASNRTPLIGMNRKEDPSKRQSDEAAVTIDESYLILAKDVEFMKPLGAGYYGLVFLGEWRYARAAIKQCNNDVETRKFLVHSKTMMTTIPHQNLLQVLGVSVDGPNPFIVSEYCPNGTLKGKILPKKQQREHALKIASAVASLHDQDIVHGNLSARNVLIDYSGEPKVSDYGRASVVQQILKSKKPIIEATKWMSPESLKDKTFTKQSDVWSYGILLYELVTAKDPHDADDDQFTVAVKIRDEGLTPVIPSDCDTVLKQVMEMCWRPNPNDRPSMKDIVNLLTKHSESN